MIFVVPFVAVAYFILYVLARSVPGSRHNGQIPLRNDFHQETTRLGPQMSLDAWIDWEEKVALQKLLDNIAPGGTNTQMAVPGTVIASPSRDSPDYYFQWIRDAGITLSTLVSLYEANSTSYLATSTIFPIMESYISLSDRIQHAPNPTGSFSDLSGLGEPKFNVDGTPFTGSWGRPQRDGPALRAITLMRYLRAYNDSHPYIWTNDMRLHPYADLYDAKLPAESVIKADLEYIAKFWSEDGFDLWEEVSGLHFFTAAVQLRALREGTDIAKAFNDVGAADFYEMQANELEKLVQKFWDDSKGHLIETLGSQRTGLDCALLLGVIHGNPDNRTGVFAPYSDEVLVSVLELVKDQRYRFPINMAPAPSTSQEDELAGVGIGRYPEDIYDGYGNSPAGGNPWFLCTSSVAEIFFRTASHLRNTEKLEMSTRAYPFWKALLPSSPIKAGQTYRSDDEVFVQALIRLKALGDEYMDVIRRHADAQGSLSEQFDRHTGFERGARDLTWSYGAFLQAVEARKEALSRQ